MNLLITGVWNDGKDYIERIMQKGHTVLFMQYEKDNLPCAYEWVEGVVCNGLFLSHSIEKFSNLRYIQLTSAGFDRVPLEYVEKNEIEIHNARGVYSIPMAEFAITGVLQLYKQMDYFRKNQEKHTWNKHRELFELYGKTVCILGCGNVGTECAKRFGAFGCDVIGVDLYPRTDKWYREIVSLEQLDSVLERVDVLVLTLPFTEETHHLINSSKLAKMKRDAVLVNIARGAIVDSEALLANIEKLGGAVLDVFEEEPLEADSPLWELENVIITPHNSFVGEGNKRRLSEMILANLEV